MQATSKIFIIGLPRTGTTSLCASLLDLDLKVAHTAYTQQSFALADVVADTPVYCHYPQLDALFPHSIFIYLERDIDSWIRSIQALLRKVQASQLSSPGTKHPLLEHCFSEIFHGLDDEYINDRVHLKDCYLRHAQKVEHYFSRQPQRLLKLAIEKNGAFNKLQAFLAANYTGRGNDREKPLAHQENSQASLPRLNAVGKITDWNNIRHPNKISSNDRGTIRAQYFDYFSS